ncbi:hypothetical protein B0H34DRAFT_700742 [Crassisporium funariophilum]|nr:hypothetical protein B0H34DRAFT_700742 [Crassisporium funariophilum]
MDPPSTLFASSCTFLLSFLPFRSVLIPVTSLSLSLSLSELADNSSLISTRSSQNIPIICILHRRNPHQSSSSIKSSTGDTRTLSTPANSFIRFVHALPSCPCLANQCLLYRRPLTAQTLKRRRSWPSATNRLYPVSYTSSRCSRSRSRSSYT